MEELKINIQSLEKERDFYFAKLRDIEVMAGHAEPAHKELAENILNILYATEVGKSQVCLKSPDCTLGTNNSNIGN